MKTMFLALFVAAVSAAPLPKDNDAVETSVNEVPDATALEDGDLVNIKVKEHAAGAVVAIDPLGFAQAAAAASTAASANSEVKPPRSKPDIPQPILTNPKPEQLPVAAAQISGKVFNDGPVKVQYNGPEDPGMLATLQDWFNQVVKYFNSSSDPAAPVPPTAAFPPRH